MIDVIGVRPLGGFRLELEFSDGTVGTRDFGSILQKSGPMVEPLKDPAYFRARVHRRWRSDVAERIRLGSDCAA
jgi:hypothetical protein